MGDAAEDYAGKPVNPVKLAPGVGGQRPQVTDEQKAQLAAYEKQVVRRVIIVFHKKIGAKNITIPIRGWL